MRAVLQLALEKDLKLNQVKFFVIDECDKVLEKLGEWSTRIGMRLSSFLWPESCVCLVHHVKRNSS